MADAAPSFPRQHARTRRFTLGIPRSFSASPDGDRLLFLRSRSGSDPLTSLWCLDAGAAPRLVVDAATIDDADDLPPAEQARRERLREMAGGITAFAADRTHSLVAFAVAGRLYTADVDEGQVVEHPVEGAFDPRPDPAGTRVAYVAGDALHLLDLVGGRTTPGATRLLAVEDGICWGRAEFVAAEEMGRTRGFWWSPEGDRIAVTRVDESPVALWHIGDPANPDRPAVPHRYPAAGSANADVRLAVLAVEGGRRVDVNWDRDTYPYLAHVGWDDGPLTLLVQTRDQRQVAVLTVDADTGATTVHAAWEDDAWVELVPGTPAWSGGRLVTVRDLADHGAQGSRALLVEDTCRTAPGVQVRAVHAVGPGRAVITWSGDDPTQIQVGAVDLDNGDLEAWTTDPGVHDYTGGVTAGALVSVALSDPEVRVVARHRTASRPLEVVAETPVVSPRVHLLELGDRGLRGALLLPTEPGDGPLPVLLDPYGGPHAQRVMASSRAFATSQWLADQGFAVLVVDGRGTPGRGPRWERAVHGNLADPVLDDQVDALRAAAEVERRLDLDRVGIRGWSFGGYLAALAVLRRPDVFRAGIAGAPVTDWRLYDTHYTERYLGHPDEDPGAYEASSLVDAAGRLLGHVAPSGDVPVPGLLIIHGLADDNVVAAHALRLSAALLAAGVAHRFLPLSGVTHMTPQETVAENLLLLQVAFLKETLGHP